MKKLYTLALAILPCLAVNAIDKETYAEIPSYFPEAFAWDMTRSDYRGTDDSGNPMLVNTADVQVEWNPTYMNESACYGKLTITNFYDNDCVEQPATIEFTNEKNLNFSVNEAGNKISFSFTGYYFSQAKTVEPYNNAYGKLSQAALLAAARKGNTNQTSRYWMDGTYTAYAYNGGYPCNCELDLETQTITISQPWGAFMTKDRYGAAPSYVIEYFESSKFENTGITGITDVKTEKPAVNDGYYYTITGQRVVNPTPGFYIHNGKKVIVK